MASPKRFIISARMSCSEKTAEKRRLGFAWAKAPPAKPDVARAAPPANKARLSIERAMKNLPGERIVTPPYGPHYRQGIRTMQQRFHFSYEIFNFAISIV